MDLSIGVGGRIGLAHMAGRTDIDQVRSLSFYAPWGGPLLLLGAAYRAGSHVRLFLEAEAGIVTQAAQATLDANDSSSARLVLQLNDAWLGGALGAGWAF
jgi:hypothetical protein